MTVYEVCNECGHEWDHNGVPPAPSAYPCVHQLEKIRGVGISPAELTSPGGFFL